MEHLNTLQTLNGTAITTMVLQGLAVLAVSAGAVIALFRRF